MGKLRDLTGMRFGKLEVLNRDVESSLKHKKKAYWLCRCDCGKTRVLDGWALFKEKSTCCGDVNCQMQREDWSSPKNMMGKKFSKLSVLCLTDDRVNGQIIWRCKCDCGNVIDVQSANLRNGNTKSCGCLRFDTRKTHGLSHKPEYQTWSGMVQRCYNPNNKAFCYYGGRGIKIHDEWRESFESFYNYIGTKPGPEYSIERIDSNGNYEPGNVKWATPLEQWNNRKIAGLSFNQYQNKSRITASYSQGEKNLDITYCVLGLASEASEVAGKWKKCMRDNNFEATAEIKKKMLDECGDTLWYLSALCSELGVTLQQVANANIKKLADRKERGVIMGEGDNR